jgi:hypothetical protein
VLLCSSLGAAWVSGNHLIRVIRRSAEALPAGDIEEIPRGLAPGCRSCAARMPPGAGPADRSLSPREDDVDVTVRERDRVRPFLVLHGDAGHGA